MNSETLKLKQPVVFQTLKNAFLNHKFAHAYLFCGNKGTPKKETALFVVQSLICQKDDGMACTVCDDCKRVLSGNYADLIYLDGSDQSIKKEDVLAIQKEFNKTGLEKFNQKVYILNHADNSSTSALNSILKFLEEPSGSKTTAIFLTDKIDNMLPTIVSRCQVINFKSITVKECYDLAIKQELDEFDSYALSHFVQDIQEIVNIASSNAYQSARTLFMEYIENSLFDLDFALTMLQINGFTKKKEKSENMEVVRYFFELYILFIKDTIKIRECKDTWWNKHLDLVIEKNYDTNKILLILLEGQDKIYKSLNISLLLDQIIYKIKEEN